MVFDKIKNAKLYFPLGEKFQKALQYLADTDFSSVEPGKYEIDGENVFALVQTYDTKPLSSAKWEAHKKYIDIHYVASGREKMGATEFEKVIIIEEYNADKDCALYKGDGNFLLVDEGYFAIFYPTDVHMPGLSINIPKPVKKVVVKVSVDNIQEQETGNAESLAPQI